MSVLEGINGSSIESGLFLKGGLDLVMVDTNQTLHRLAAGNKDFGAILEPSADIDKKIKFVLSKP